MAAALRVISVLLVLAVAARAGTVSADNDGPLSTLQLVEALAGGGYNIYFRHADTDWSQSDRIRAVGDWESCDPSQVRQLSETGRNTARRVGTAMRALRIPIAEVFASPYCRTVETARLMDVGPVQTTTDIMNLRVAEYFGGRAAIVERARTRLATKPPAGTNRVFVAHGNVAQAATPVYPDEAEAVIFHPTGRGDFEFVGRLTPDDWSTLAAEAR